MVVVMLSTQDESTSSIQMRHSLAHHRREVRRLAGLEPLLPQRAGVRVLLADLTGRGWREDEAEALAWHYERIAHFEGLLGVGQ